MSVEGVEEAVEEAKRVEALEEGEVFGEVDVVAKGTRAKATKAGQNGLDKRARNTELQNNAKRRKMEGTEDDLPIYATKFSQEEIKSERRKPKRKVAVMIGYSGSGYKGMQLNHKEKTIEGDLFAAFVAAGGISKANADDPKKSSLVRCARTDKGVHAAGNVISLKLIIEDPDIVSKINEKLSPQIRVWGIEQTNASFNSYQLCDSRIYEYLIPTHSFIPPHPSSFLGRKIAELAEEANDLEGYKKRQEDAANFWAETEDKYIKPLLGDPNGEHASIILKAFYETNQPPVVEDPLLLQNLERFAASIIPDYKTAADRLKPPSTSDPAPTSPLQEAPSPPIDNTNNTPPNPPPPPHEPSALDILTRRLKDLHTTAKKSYRIPPPRLDRVRSTLSRYTGSHRFHNYTIDKTIRDPSATRVIKSFTASPSGPITINATEWLSLKVHGQSFMMHQIRKMVSMAALLVRCGCPEGRIQDTYAAERLSIPKAPALGLLLERPVFDEYNRRLVEFGRGTVDFARYAGEVEAFKQREIYGRVFREEEREGGFVGFWAGLDGARSAQLLFLSSLGVEGVKRDVGGGTGAGGDEGGEEVVAEEEEGKDQEMAVEGLDEVSSDDDVDDEAVGHDEG